MPTSFQTSGVSLDTLETDKREVWGQPTPTNRQTITPLKTVTSEDEVYQPPTIPPTCTGSLSIPDTRGTNLVQPIQQTTHRHDPVEEDMDFLRISLRVLKSSWRSLPMKQIWHNKNSHRLKQSCTTTRKLLSPTKKTDKLYNHHKCLISACYKLYKYVDHNKRKQRDM